MKKIILALVLLVVSINWGQAQVVTFPYEDGFETWTADPDPLPDGGWRIFKYGNNSWKKIEPRVVVSKYSTTYYNYPRNASNAAVCVESSLVEDANTWLISPRITVPSAEYFPIIDFWYGSQDAYNHYVGEGSFSVLISTNRNDTSKYELLESFVVKPEAWYSAYTGIYTYEYQQAKVSLADYAGQNVYIAIRATSSKRASGIIIDDFHVKTEGGLAPDISNVQSYKSATEITMSWESDNIGTHYITISGYSDTIKLDGSAKRYVFGAKENIQPNHTYTVKIWGDSPSLSTIKTPVTTFTVSTVCETITTAQGGNNYFWKATSAGSCFQVVDRTTSKLNRTWSGFSYTNSGVGTTHANDWLLTPPMQVPYEHALILKINHTTLETRHPDKFSVWFIPFGTRDDQLESKGINILPTRELCRSVAEGDSLIIDLRPYDLGGREGRFAVRAETKGIYANIYLQEVSVRALPNCRPPVIVDVIDLEKNSAKIKIPSKTTKGSIFEIKYSEGIDADPAAIVNGETFNVEDAFEMNNLKPGTNYYVYVRTLCGDDGNSVWTRKFFRTPYVIETFPYAETFDANVNKELEHSWNKDGLSLGNWTRIDRNGDYGVWMVGDITIYGDATYPCVGVPWSNYYDEDRDQLLVSPKIVMGTKAKELGFEATHSKIGVTLSVLISEDPTFTEGNYEVLYSKEDFLTKVAHGVNFIPHSLEIPYSYANKEVYVAFRLQASPEAAIDITQFGLRNVTIEEVNDLKKPTNFRIESLVGNTITTTWDGDASSYRLACFQAIFDPTTEPDGVIYRTTAAKSVSLTLPSGSDYYFYIQANYSNGSSKWLGPIDTTIGCEAEFIKVPHIETMDSWTFAGDYPLGCWHYYDTTFLSHFPLLDKNGNPVQVNNKEGFDTYLATPNSSGSGFRFLRSQGHPDTRFSTDLRGKYLVSPPIECPAEGLRVSFQANSESANIPKSVFKVFVNMQGPLPQDFKDVSISDPKMDSIMTYGWKSFSFDFKPKQAPPAGTKIWVAIQAMNGYCLSVDEIVFNAVSDNCALPTDVKFAADPLLNTADLSISAKTSESATIQVVYQTTSFNPTLDFGNADTVSLVYNADSLKHVGVLKGMNPGQMYYIWLRSTCNNGASYTDWVGPFKEYGACGPVTVFPYDAPFKKGTATGSLLPDYLCWETRGDYGGFTTYVSGRDYFIHSGFDMTLPGNSKMNEWLITPRIKITKSSALSFSFQTERFLNEKFEVLVSTSGKEEGDFVPLNSNMDETYRGGTHHVNGRIGYFATSLDDYIGQDIYLAIVHRTENTADTVGRIISRGDNNGQPTRAARAAKLIIRDLRISENDCSSVSGVTSDIDNNNIATVNWNETSATGWVIRYGDNYFIPTKSITGGTDVHVTSNSWTVPYPVKPTKQVRFYIRANCDGATWFGPYFVRNDKAINDFPYTEDFENWDIAPSFTGFWKIIDGDNDGHTITSSDGRATTDLAGNYSGQNNSKAALYEHSSYGNDFITEWNDWLISPQFDFTPKGWQPLNPLLDFWSIVHNWYNTSVYGEKYGIYIGESTNVEDMILIDSIRWSSSQSWINKQVYLRDYIDDNNLSESSIYIGLKDMSNPADMYGNSRAIAFDNFRIRDVGECYPPSGVEVASVSSSTAKLKWKDEAGVTMNGGAGYKVMYAIGAFNPEVGSSTTRSVIATEKDGSDGKVFVELENLVENHTYYVYLSPTCEGANFIWSGPFTFKTDKIIEEYPYEQSFNWRSSLEITLDNREWTSIDGNDDGYTWTIAGDATTLEEFVRVLIQPAYNCDTTDEWLISPPFVLPRETKVKFNYIIPVNNHPNEESFDLLIGRREDVRYENNTFDINAFDLLKSYKTNGPGGDEVFTHGDGFGDSEGVTFDDFNPGDTVYFAFHMYSSVSKQNFTTVAINQFDVTSNNPCGSMPTNLALVGNASKDSALVAWTPVAGQTEWAVEYRQDGEESWTPIDEFSVLEPRYVFKGLSSETLYNVRVKALCADSYESRYVATDILIPSNCEPIVESKVKDSIGRNSIAFRMDSDAKGFEIRYALKNTEYWSVWSAFEKDTLITNLTAATDYTFEFITICQDGDRSKVFSKTYSTLSECFPPNALRVTDVTQTSATLSWSNDVTSEVYFIVEWKLAGKQWSELAGKRNNVRDTFATITNLVSGTDYDWRVRTVCGENYESDNTPSMFKTVVANKYTVALKVDGSGRGTVGVKNGPQGGGYSEEYNDNASVTIVATPASGHRFVSWTDDADDNKTVSTTSELLLTVTKDVAYTANFIRTCSAPTNLNVEEQFVDSTILTWTGAASKYEVQYWRGNDVSTVFTDTVEEQSILLRGLMENQTYYWKVKAICEEEDSDYTLGNSFRAIRVSISDINKNVQVRITPNPVTDPRVVTVEVEGVVGKINWTLLDETGKIYNRGQERNASKFQIDVNGLARGTYLVRLVGESWETTKLIIVQ